MFSPKFFWLFYVCGDSRRLVKRQFRKMCVDYNVASAVQRDEAKRNRAVLGEYIRQPQACETLVSQEVRGLFFPNLKPILRFPLSILQLATLQ